MKSFMGYRLPCLGDMNAGCMLISFFRFIDKSPKFIPDMKKISLLAIALSTSLVVQAQTVVDDFSGALSAYTLTPVLYSGGSVPATTTISFSDSTGALQATAASFSNIEQALFLRNDFTLAVGQKLSVSVNWSLGNSQDLGLCVASVVNPPAASTNPLGNTRTSLSYAYIGIRGTTDHVISGGFDGATGLSTVQSQPGSGTTSTVFVSRTSATTFQMGFNTSSVNGGADTILTTYTFVNSANVGNAIGFYTDMRANGSIGTFDNLTISPIPEPSAMAICGLGFASLLAFKRFKK